LLKLQGTAVCADTARRKMSSFFGFMCGDDKFGRWVPEPEINATAVMGRAIIDFSQALFQHPVITVSTTAFWGGVTVIVPANVRVEQDGQAIFGGFGDQGGIYTSSCTDDSVYDRNKGVTVRIVGTAFMGAVQVMMNKRAAPADLLSHEEVERILRDVPAEPSTTAQDLFDQVIGTAVAGLASTQQQQATLLQAETQLQAALVQHITDGMTTAVRQQTAAYQAQTAAEDQLRAALSEGMATAARQHTVAYQAQTAAEDQLRAALSEGMTSAARQSTAAYRAQAAAEDQLRAALTQQMTIGPVR